MDDGDESTLASLADVYCGGELLAAVQRAGIWPCLLYTSPSPRD